MPNLTIYVPDPLAEQVRDADLNVSRVCQKALDREIRLTRRKASGVTGATARVDRQRTARRTA